MERIKGEAFGLRRPRLAVELVRGEALQGLESAAEVVGSDKVGKMLAQLLVAVVVEAPDGGLLDGSVHPLDLAVGPGMLCFGRAVLDIVRGTGVFECMGPEAFAIGDGFFNQRHGGPSGTGCSELDAIVGEHGVDPVRDGADQAQQELARDSGGGLLVQFDKGELRGAIDGDEHVQLALFGTHLGNVDVEIADRIALELLLRRPVAIDIRQAADAVALQAAVQRGARQVRDRRLQRIEAVIKRQQRVAPESNDNGFLLDGEDRRSRLLRAGRKVRDRRSLAPLGNGLLIEAVALGKRPQALLTMLYRSTHRLCRRGAPMKNLAHSASFDSEDKDAPSKIP